MTKNPYRSKFEKRYRPSNGTEREIVFGCLCADCRKATRCTLVDRSMMFQIDDPNYPQEFIRDENGDPQCTARDVGPTTIEELAEERSERRQHRAPPRDGLFGSVAP